MTALPNFHDLAADVLRGVSVDEVQALQILQVPDEQLMDVVAAGSQIRRHYFSNRIKLNYLVSLKSGLCPENCNYCSQALGSTAPILKYS